MTTKYSIQIADGEVLYFDAQHQPSQGFPPVIGGLGKPPMLVWPLANIDVTSKEWDEALADYHIDQRRAAKVRVIEE